MLYELCAVTSVEEFPMFMLEEEESGPGVLNYECDAMT